MNARRVSNQPSHASQRLRMEWETGDARRASHALLRQSREEDAQFREQWLRRRLRIASLWAPALRLALGLLVAMAVVMPGLAAFLGSGPDRPGDELMFLGYASFLAAPGIYVLLRRTLRHQEVMRSRLALAEREARDGALPDQESYP